MAENENTTPKHAEPEADQSASTTPDTQAAADPSLKERVSSLVSRFRGLIQSGDGDTGIRELASTQPDNSDTPAQDSASVAEYKKRAADIPKAQRRLGGILPPSVAERNRYSTAHQELRKEVFGAQSSTTQAEAPPPPDPGAQDRRAQQEAASPAAAEGSPAAAAEDQTSDDVSREEPSTDGPTNEQDAQTADKNITREADDKLRQRLSEKVRMFDEMLGRHGLKSEDLRSAQASTDTHTLDPGSVDYLAGIGTTPNPDADGILSSMSEDERNELLDQATDVAFDGLSQIYINRHETGHSELTLQQQIQQDLAEVTRRRGSLTTEQMRHERITIGGREMSLLEAEDMLHNTASLLPEEEHDKLNFDAGKRTSADTTDATQDTSEEATADSSSATDGGPIDYSKIDTQEGFMTAQRNLAELKKTINIHEYIALKAELDTAYRAWERRLAEESSRKWREGEQLTTKDFADETQSEAPRKEPSADDIAKRGSRARFRELGIKYANSTEFGGSEVMTPDEKSEYLGYQKARDTERYANETYDQTRERELYSKALSELWDKKRSGEINQNEFDVRLDRINDVFYPDKQDVQVTTQAGDVDPEAMYTKIEADLREKWDAGEISTDEFRTRVRRAQAVRDEGRPKGAVYAESSGGGGGAEATASAIPDTPEEFLGKVDEAKDKTPNPADLLTESGVTPQQLADILNSTNGEKLAEAMRTSPEAAKAILQEIQKAHAAQAKFKAICEENGWPFDEKQGMEFAFGRIADKLGNDMEGGDAEALKKWGVLKVLLIALSIPLVIAAAAASAELALLKTGTAVAGGRR